MSAFDSPPGGQYNGWYQYFDRDIPKLLHIKQPQPFANAYCGAGNLKRCRQAVWGAIAAAGKSADPQQHSANPSAWRASATDERITFIPGLLKYTMSLHQPAERDPAGDQLQPPPLRETPLLVS